MHWEQSINHDEPTHNHEKATTQLASENKRKQMERNVAGDLFEWSRFTEYHHHHHHHNQPTNQSIIITTTNKPKTETG